MPHIASLFNTICRPTLREIPAGGTIFRQGDPARDIFLVSRGQVRLVRYTAEGEMLTQYRATAGQTFAEAALFSDIYHCTAVTDTASCVACFCKESLLRGLAKRPTAMLDLVALLSRQVRQLRTLLEIRSIRSARERVLQYLRLYTNPNTGACAIPDHLKDLAGELGLAHETFYRVLASLVKEGVITRNAGSIRVRP